MGPGEAADALDALTQRQHVALVAGPHADLRFGKLRDDIERLAAVGDDAVDAGVFGQLLAQRADAVEREDHGVQRVRLDRERLPVALA